MFQFTVLTPTRNRAHVLHRVYESLRDQSFRDFEWLIIDNGSTDGTADLVEGWQQIAGFPIRYLAQENAGVHVSWNRGVAEARGRLLLEIRSADTFVDTAPGKHALAATFLLTSIEVTHDVPSGEIWIGAPARAYRRRRGYPSRGEPPGGTAT